MRLGKPFFAEVKEHSDVAALRERAASDGLPIAPAHEFVDEG